MTSRLQNLDDADDDNADVAEEGENRPTTDARLGRGEVSVAAAGKGT